MKPPHQHASQFPAWRHILFALLSFCSLNTAMAERWFLGIPDSSQPNLIHFRTPVPDAFVTKIMQANKQIAPFGKSYQRVVNGKSYAMLEQSIAWDSNHQGGNSVTFVTPQAGGGTFVGATWIDFSGNEWNLFKQSILRISKVYGAPSTWREAKPMVMQIPGTGPTNVTINLIAPFVASDAPPEQKRYDAHSPRIVAVPVGNSIAVGYQTELNGTAKAAVVATYRPGNSKPAWMINLPLKVFGGLTSDGQNIYALSAHDEDLDKELSTVTFRRNILNMVKFNGDGRLLWSKDLNNPEIMGSSVNKGMEGNAIYSPFAAGTAQLAYGNGQVAVVMACNTTPDIPIRSRHQRAVFFTVNASDGSGSASQHETSWRHSFDQRAIFDGLDFVFADLGDAGWYMPAAGITLRKGQPINGKTNFVPKGVNEGVYAFARFGDLTSSSNFSFTSLGDIVYDQKGYGVLFTSQRKNFTPPANGWSTPIQAPRQLAFVHIVEGFEHVQDGTLIQNGTSIPRLGNVTMAPGFKPGRINITEKVVDSRGTNAGPFSHPTRTNTAFNQHGVVWITQLANGVSAERPKMVRLSSRVFLALWEEWTYQGTGQSLKYKETKAVLLHDRGNGGYSPGAARTINARLNPSGADRVFVRNDQMNWITGGHDGRLTLHQVDANLNLSSQILGESPIPNGSAPTIPKRSRSTSQQIAAGGQPGFPQGKYFHMTTKFAEENGLVLESYPAVLRKKGNYTGMSWKAIPVEAAPGYFYLTTEFLAPQNQVLEGGDGQGPSIMVPNTGVSGTIWKAVPAGNGYYHLTSMFMEKPGKVLNGNVGDAAGAQSPFRGAPHMVDQKATDTGSMWKFIPLPSQ